MGLSEDANMKAPKGIPNPLGAFLFALSQIALFNSYQPNFHY